MPRLPIDYWIICDETHAYLFFTGDNGRVYRSRTTMEEFPKGMSEPETIISESRETVFEGSMTYKLKGIDKYLTLVEGLGPNRYYRAYLADRSDGQWTPIPVATRMKPRLRESTTWRSSRVQNLGPAISATANSFATDMMKR